MDKSLHNYHYGTIIIVNSYRWLSCILRIRGFHVESLFFLTMGSAALEVAAEIPIWEMEKRTLRSEAVSCPTDGFHARHLIRVSKIVNVPRDACTSPLYYLIISINKYTDHPNAPCTSNQKPFGNAHYGPRRKIVLTSRSRPLSCVGDDASTRTTRLKYPLRILYNVASALPHGNPQASGLQESAALRTRMTRLLADITERSQYGFL